MLRTRAAASVPFVILLAAGAVLPAAPFDPQDKPSPRVLYRAPVQTTRACVRDVPNLVRSDIEAARAIVAKYQLALGDVRYQESRLPKGTILDQTVSPGSQVKCGTAIPVIVSRGPGVTDDVRVPPRGGNGARGQGGTSDGPPAGSQTSDGPPTGGTRVTRCPVPNLIERDINQVQPTLRSAAATERQWSIGRVERVESTAAPGTILKQSPQPGTYMVCGSAIDVLIAVPGQSCTVPDLTNRPIAEAQALLQRRKWSIGRVERVESRAPEGTILRQSPAPGV